MAAPSKSFTVIPDGDIDPDSPLTTGLFTELRDNDIHLEEWLGLSFVAAQDHDHDNINSKAVAIGVLFSSALFNLSTSVTTAVSTGALSFEPKIVIVVGMVDAGGSNDSVYAGFATGTGTLARSLAHRVGGVTGYSVDADSIGGRSNSVAGATTHDIDLDVTNFAKASPGIEFTPSANAGTWTFKVLVFGFTA